MGHGLHDSAQSGGWDLSVPTLDHLTHSIMYKHILSLHKEKHGLTLVKYYEELSENFFKKWNFAHTIKHSYTYSKF